MKIKILERNLKDKSKIVFKLTTKKSVEFVTDIVFLPQQIEFNKNRSLFIGLDANYHYLNKRIIDYKNTILYLSILENNKLSLYEIKTIIKSFLKNGTIDLLFELTKHYFLFREFPKEQGKEFMSRDGLIWIDDVTLDSILDLAKKKRPKRFTFNFIVNHRQELFVRLTYERNSIIHNLDVYSTDYIVWNGRRNRFEGGDNYVVYQQNVLIINIELALEKFQYLFYLKEEVPNIKEIKKRLPTWNKGFKMEQINNLNTELSKEIDSFISIY